MQSANQNTFLSLVRMGIGHSSAQPDVDNWQAIKALADKQRLTAVVADGIEKLQDTKRPPKELLLQWIGEVLQGEATFKLHKEVASDMANLFHCNQIRTYVLKGLIVAECYPRHNHRVSVDMDCYLKSEKEKFDAWKVGNDLIEAKQFEVSSGYYKNSTFHLPGLSVENHKFLTPFRGNKRLASLEKLLQSFLNEDTGEDIIEGTWLYRPPVIVSALFLIEHAYSHFLHEGLTWRMVLDWVLFSEKHRNEIDWPSLEVYVDKFGFRKFFDSYNRLGLFLLEKISEDDLSKPETKMLEDVWNPLDLHKTLHGIRGKLSLVGNTWRARWKYHYFAEISMLHALWIQVYGFLFEKHPALD